MKLIDLVGQTFGQLTVTARAPKSRTGEARWTCACACGGQTIVGSYDLRHAHATSCGCARARFNRATKTIHGKHGTPEYGIWCGMKKRCENPKNYAFDRYGGRGIRVCKRWSKSFENFLADVGPRPTPDHSIDRINNNGHYEPGNVRWATATEQARNRRPRNVAA